MTRIDKHKNDVRIPPQPHTQTPQIPSIKNSIKDSIISGFGFGIGSSIAHKVSDSIFTSSPNPVPIKKIDCSQLRRDLETCYNTCDRDCHSMMDFYYKNCDKIDSL